MVWYACRPQGAPQPLNSAQPDNITRKAGSAPRIPLARYRFRFTASDPIRFPEYSGSAWRGVFGHALRDTVCVTRQPACPGCLLYRSCVYSYIFETPPPENTERMRKYTAAPHPFVIWPAPHGRTVAAGEGFEIEMTLIGRAAVHLAYVIHALEQAGRRGITGRRARFELLDVQQQDKPGGATWQRIYRPGEPLAAGQPGPADIPACPSAVTIELHSPLRLKRDGRLVTPESFAFHDLFRNLLRRLSLLSYFHTDTPLDADFATLSRTSRDVPLAGNRLRWRDWTRYSSRQRASMRMGGLVGEISLDGDALEPFWPWLWTGQWVHAGKGTSMGLGCYRIRAASLQQAD